MKLSTILLAGVATVAATGAQAQTFSNIWSFNDLGSGTTVSGTLSGLTNGSDNSAQGLAATLTSSPFADLLGTYNIDASAGGEAYGYNNYSVSNNVVSYAIFYFTNNAGTELFFGTNPDDRTYYPELINYAGTENAYNYYNGTAFTAVASTGAVPETATWAMMLAGFGMVGFAMRRRQSVKTTVRFA